VHEPIARAFLEWFALHRTDYPFRKNRDPYKVWVSEVALQQTRIQAALEQLEIFLQRFPDLSSLATATEKEVLFFFQGLGYYNRARNLRLGAQHIVRHFQGKLPEDYASLLTIPSIGPYTAAAIASIAYGVAIPAIDGNVKRVIARLLALVEAVSEKGFSVKISSFLQGLFERSGDNPGNLNEAIMELGQKICTPRSPLCAICPISFACAAKAQNHPEQYPVRSLARPKMEEVHCYLIIQKRGDQVFLHSWQNFRFLRRHHGYPALLYHPETEQWESSWQNLPPKHLLQEMVKASAFSFSHAITRYRIKVFLCKTCSLPEINGLWFAQEDLIPSFLRKAWMASR